MISPFQKQYPKIHPSAYISMASQVIGRVLVHKDASVWPGAVLRGDINRIEVGQGANIQDNAVLHVERNKPCVIEKNVTVGHQATIHACKVKEGSLIGIGARILNGAVIGRFCLVGANSLVLENMKIPDRSLVVGTPARVVRKLTLKEIAGLKKSALNYIKLAKEYRKHNAFLYSEDIKPIQNLSRVF